MESLMETSYDRPMNPLTWPHGIITSCRAVLLFDVLLARSARTFSGPYLNAGEHVFMVLLVLLLLSEAIYSWLHIHRNGQIWTKMLLFYPFHAVAMFADGLCMVNLLNDYRLLAPLLPMGWPIFWASLEMITSLFVPVFCAIHLCFGQTLAIAVDEYRQLFSKSMDLARGQDRHSGQTSRNGYEGIE